MNSVPSSSSKKTGEKSLENMMMECSNMITKEKMQTFAKIRNKQLTNSASTSQHNVSNWKGQQNTTAASVVSKQISRFPSWCCKEIVPPLYRQIEHYVTDEGRSGINNGLLLPVLVSSGLHREILAHIWEVTNQNIPGVLSPEELYATLAIVALYQAGYNVQSVEALHYFPAPPLPVVHPPAVLNPISITPSTSTSTPIPVSPLPPSTPPPPISISPGPPSINSSQISPGSTGGQFYSPFTYETIPNYSSTSKELEKAIPEDDFADFQSGIILPPVEEKEINDDFGDFKQATISENSRNSTLGLLRTVLSANSPKTEKSDDRYAVFKDLEESPQNVIVEDESLLQSLKVLSVSAENPDDFGDFLAAPVDNYCTPIESHEDTNISILKPIGNIQNFNFSVTADFESANFKKIENWGSESLIPADRKSLSSLESPLYIYETDNLDNVSLSSFHHSPLRNRKLDVEDDISFDKLSLGQLGEPVSDPGTQSVGSQDSITDPALENSDPESTEKSISSFPLADRYSFIRNEQQEETLDKVSSEWLKCLLACKNILLSAKDIFLSAKELNVLNELFDCEEIENYIHDFSQVFCVSRRISASSLTSGRYSGDIQFNITELETIWEDLSLLTSPQRKLPEKSFFDSPYCHSSQDFTLHCSVCLLDVNCNSIDENGAQKLTYGGREYHSSCANLWVNCVDFILPALAQSELI